MGSFLKFLKITLFIVLGIFLTLSISLSLLLFGVDQSLYSWRFFSQRINETGAVLSTESIRKSLVKELVDPLIKSLGRGVPSGVNYMVQEAAFATFTGSWFVKMGENLVKTVQSLLKRKISSLSYSISLQTFKNNLEVILYRSGQFSEQEIQRGLRDIPNQVNLNEMISQKELIKVEKLIRTYPLYSHLIMYGFPLFFIILSFVTGSLRSGIVVTGSSFLVAGALAQAGKRYLLKNYAHVAGLFLNRRMVIAFDVPLSAAAVDFTEYLTPAIGITFFSAVLIFSGGFFLDRALKKGDILNIIKKVKYSQRSRPNTLPRS